ncbi:MAG: S4 domain-containing protein [Saprospiraceae bacterium]|nr:S4 domain-containing protein [Saprospiraceae bacterium]
MKKIRIDKWLWSVRVFKSRTLASNACKGGRVRIEEVSVKASSTVEVGQRVQVKKNGFDLEFKVIKLIEKRVGAPLAVQCYEDFTHPDELNKFRHWFVGKGKSEMREKGIGRPTKKDRREIDDYKGVIYEDLEEWDEQK